MATASDQELVVKIKQRGLINATGLPQQEHWLPLSNLDLLLPAVDIGLFFIYQNQIGESKFSQLSFNSKLKRSLGEALVTFYALAGEVVENSAGEPELLCNNRGVDFIEAHANVQLTDLNLYNAEECLEGKLVPQKDGGVLFNTTYPSDLLKMSSNEKAKSRHLNFEATFLFLESYDVNNKKKHNYVIKNLTPCHLVRK